MEEAGELVLLPECTAGFLIDHLIEIGPTVPTGFGPAAFGWREVEAWQNCIGVDLPPWQARLLVQLSREYAGFAAMATEPDCSSPLEDEPGEDRRAQVARELRVGFRALMSVQKQKGA